MTSISYRPALNHGLYVGAQRVFEPEPFHHQQSISTSSCDRPVAGAPRDDLYVGAAKEQAGKHDEV
jgi:hypothetical protein